MPLSALNLGTTGIKDLIGSYIRGHTSEIAIVGIVFAITVSIAILAIGDITEFFVGGRRRR
jgi:hypothetical protein